jgi:hypothetical protein
MALLPDLTYSPFPLPLAIRLSSYYDTAGADS